MAIFFYKKAISANYAKIACVECMTDDAAQKLQTYMQNQGFTAATQEDWDNAAVIYQERFMKL